MGRNWTPSIVPSDHDQTIYLVVNKFGYLGTAFTETDVEQSDLETVITDLMSGQYSDRFAWSHSTSQSIGRKMFRKMSR